MRRSRQAGQAMPSVVAVVSVVAIVVALVAFFAGGRDGDVAQPQAAQQPQSDQASASPSPQSPPGDPQTAARAPEQEKAGKREPARAGKAKKDGRRVDRAKRRPRPDLDAGPPDVYVEVYNNTSVTGLAAATAAELQDAGWQVVGVDNWRGDIPASTVYYPAGFEDEAQELAETLGIGRLHGAVAPMKFDRLTVILTADAA